MKPMAFLLALVLLGCGGQTENRIEIRGRRYVVLPESRLAVNMIEEIVKSHVGSLECGSSLPECRKFFLERFDEYVRYVNVDVSGNGRITYSLVKLGPEHFRGNPKAGPNEGCSVVRVDVGNFAIVALRCSPEP